MTSTKTVVSESRIPFKRWHWSILVDGYYDCGFTDTRFLGLLAGRWSLLRRLILRAIFFSLKPIVVYVVNDGVIGESEQSHRV